jgi:glucan phosphoethanolaminetransferase (alkaline phosphatase superfamily)
MLRIRIITMMQSVGSLRYSAATAFKFATIIIFVVLTNHGLPERLALVASQGKWVTFVGYIGLWTLSLGAVLIVAFHHNILMRASWAAVIAVTTAAGFGFRAVSGYDFWILDAMTLWLARHEASRAAELYASELKWALFIIVLGITVLMVPPLPRSAVWRRWLARLTFAPAVPIAIIAVSMVIKYGTETQIMPVQFAPLSASIVAGAELSLHPIPKREAISWTAAVPKARHIVMLVDESVRADYIDLSRGNFYTPEIARLAPRLVDFGPAASGGNCSYSSNAILRFAGARNEIGPKLLTNPTIWQYAKNAGFRTVFIDAQRPLSSNGRPKLQNFMTTLETNDIDHFRAIDSAIPAYARDDKLLDIIIEELKSDQPVFIYANKMGSHFPYDKEYPASATVFHPTMTESDSDNSVSRVASYRNAVKWSVDRIFQRLFAELNLNDTVIIYTSDHGQSLVPGQLTHCTVENPDPRQGLVPLFVIAGDEIMRSRFATAAKASVGHGSHFSIVPTALQLFGYNDADVASVYSDTLLEKDINAPAFTTGDIFGLFSTKVLWHPIDLHRDYLEPPATALQSGLGHGRAAGLGGTYAR